MDKQERDNFIQHDNKMRTEIIKNAVLIGLTNKDLCNNAKNTQNHFCENYDKYSGNILSWDKYKASDFWFNDAGFQFKWRNFEYGIQLECISWNDVTKLIRQIA